MAGSLAPPLHGGITGVQDVVQDYGALLFLAAVVMIGAGVLVWVLLSPQPEDDDGGELRPAEAAEKEAPGD